MAKPFDVLIRESRQNQHGCNLKKHRPSMDVHRPANEGKKPPMPTVKGIGDQASEENMLMGECRIGARALLEAGKQDSGETYDP
jgi:hypothetical protein